VTLTIYLCIVVGFGLLCGVLSRDGSVGLGAGIGALIVVGAGWGIYDSTEARIAAYHACYDACLAVDAPVARTHVDGCWCYRGASETFRVEVPE